MELDLTHPRTNSDATLTSLAIINVNWESKRASYLDNFVPYALEAIRLNGGSPLQDRDIAAAIADRFGLSIPVHVVTSLLGRAAKQKLIERDPKTRDVALAPGAEEKLPDIATQQQDCKRQQNHLVRSLIDFAHQRFELEWDTATAESALVDYIESHAIGLLSTYVRGSAFSAPTEDPTQGRGYIVSAFVAGIVEHDPVGFGYIDQMVKGSMLASALYLATPGDVQRRFKRTTLYLDTPVCLRAIGHEGAEAEEAAQQMLRLALSQGAELACFSHNVKEMRGILQGTKSALRRTTGAESALRGVATHFRAMGYTENDVNLAVERLDRDLMHNRITVTQTPEHTPHYTVDEVALEELLQERVNYNNESARLPDLNSLTAIHRIRHGQSGPHMETSRAVLVTNNAALVRASREFFNSGRHEWPLAMLDHTLAALVWVKEPTVAPDLPRRQVIADCYAALAPSSSLWLRIADEIDRLDKRGGISPEDVALLRYSNEAQQSLMDVTLGDPRRVTPKAIQDALAKARTAVSAPAAQKAAEAADRALKAEAAEAESTFKATEKSAEAESLRSRLEALESRDTSRADAIRTQAATQVNTLNRGITYLVYALLGLALVSGVASFFPVIANWLPGWLNLIVRIGGAISVPLGLFITMKGKSIRERMDARADHLRDGLINKRLQRAGLAEHDTGGAG